MYHANRTVTGSQGKWANLWGVMILFCLFCVTPAVAGEADKLDCFGEVPDPADIDPVFYYNPVLALQTDCPDLIVPGKDAVDDMETDCGLVDAFEPEATDEYDAITYDYTTNAIQSISAALYDPQPQFYDPPSHGSLPEGGNELIDTIFGDDERYIVDGTTAYPWRSVVRIFLGAVNRGTGGCSGSLIGEYHVLTAAHCVYDYDAGQFHQDMTIAPGVLDGVANFGFSHPTKAYIPYEYFRTGSRRFDFAVIALDRRIGAFTGYMTMGAFSLDYLNSHTAHTAGYPRDIDNGLSLIYTWSDALDVTANSFLTCFDVIGRQSGSPVWYYLNGIRYTAAVATAETVDVNIATRITQEGLDAIIHWMTADESVPFRDDRPDLVSDGYPGSGFSTTNVIPGVTDFVAYHEINNIGTVYVGGAHADFYVSTDQTISSADYLLGRVTLDVAFPFEPVLANWGGTFPASIPTGNYYVGFIVDPEHSFIEYSENNNTGLVSPTKINVTIRHWIVAGYVRMSGGDPLPNVQVQGFPSTVTTNEDGFFTYTVPEGWDGTLTPVKTNYEFTPASIYIPHVYTDNKDNYFSAQTNYCSDKKSTPQTLALLSLISIGLVFMRRRGQ